MLHIYPEMSAFVSILLMVFFCLQRHAVMCSSFSFFVHCTHTLQSYMDRGFRRLFPHVLGSIQSAFFNDWTLIQHSALISMIGDARYTVYWFQWMDDTLSLPYHSPALNFSRTSLIPRNKARFHLDHDFQAALGQWTFMDLSVVLLQVGNTAIRTPSRHSTLKHLANRQKHSGLPHRTPSGLSEPVTQPGSGFLPPSLAWQRNMGPQSMTSCRFCR